MRVQVVVVVVVVIVIVIVVELLNYEIIFQTVRPGIICPTLPVDPATSIKTPSGSKKSGIVYIQISNRIENEGLTEFFQVNGRILW